MCSKKTEGSHEEGFKENIYYIGDNCGYMYGFVYGCLGLYRLSGILGFNAAGHQRGDIDFWEKHNIDYDNFCDVYNIEKTEIISSFDGHTIPADYIHAPAPPDGRNNNTVIMVHGLGDNRYANYPTAAYFLDRGYNVITYDQRSTNENTAEYTTFGYWEKYDLLDWLDYARQQTPGQRIGVWGASFGGATAALAAGYENTDTKIDFLILDCPISSMERMIELETAGMETGLPVSYITWCGNAINRIMRGFAYSDADAARTLRGANIPILIINSRADTITPYYMGRDIYEAAPQAQIRTVEDSPHCEIWLDHNTEYRGWLDAFLADI
ncbi:MAG: alpha/beta hydrolase [Eubacteriales bacterium]|nr:alpha/beta hydrolase [Eubacteriales bacterium]